jgi:hypothetical protein
MMRLAVGLLLVANGWAQISWGARAGVPLNSALETFSSRTNFENRPKYWLFGPALEIRLPKRLAITFDALYQRLEFDGPGGRRTGGEWDFPATMRYRFGQGAVRPFVAGGGSFNKITGIAAPRSSVTGIVMGGGVELKLPLVRIAPELRYTHRLEENITLDGLRSQRNRAWLLVGLTF